MAIKFVENLLSLHYQPKAQTYSPKKCVLISTNVNKRVLTSVKAFLVGISLFLFSYSDDFDFCKWI
jgi:hypothetical protein